MQHFTYVKRVLIFFIICLLLTSSVFIPTESQAADWSMFRGGIERNGVTPFAILPPLKRIWRFPTMDNISASPIYADGRIYLASEDAKLYAINAKNGNKIWQFKAGKSIRSTPLHYKGALIFGCDDDFLYKLKAADGSLIWKKNLGGKISASPLLIENRILVGTEAGEFYALSYKSGEMIWKKRGYGSIRSSATYYGGTVIFGCQNLKVSALQVEDGKTVWEYKTNGSVFSTPVHVDNKIYFGSDDTKMYIVYAKTGKLIRAISLTGKVRSSAAVIDGRIVVGCEDGYIYALDEATGNVVWRHYTAKPVTSSPVIAAKEIVYAGSTDHYFYVLDYDTGKILWDFSTLGPIVSSPIIVDDMVFFASNENRLYAYKAEKSTATHQYELGKKLMKEGKFTEAIKNLELTLKLNPKNRAAKSQIKQAHIKMGEGFLSKGNFKRGYREIEKALVLDAGEDEVKEEALDLLLEQGGEILADGDFDLAQEAIDSILKLDDSYQPTIDLQAELLFLQGKEKFNLKDYEGALSLFEKASQLSPDIPELSRYLSDSRFQSNLTGILIAGGIGTLIVLILLYLLYRKFYFKKHLRLAEMYMLDQKFSEAASEYEKICKVKPRSRPLKLQLAKARIDAGNSSAVIILKEILKLPGDQDEVYAELARYYMKKIDLGTEAIDAYNKALEKDSYNLNLLNIIAQAYIHHKQVRSALQIFEKIVSIYPKNLKFVTAEVTKLCKNYPKNTMLLASLARFLVTGGDYSHAIANLRKVRKLEPQKKDVLIVAYNQILEKSPNNFDALIDQGQLTYESNDFKAAATHFIKAYEIDPENSELQTLIEAVFPKIMDLEPKNTQVGEWLADYYTKSRRHTDAIGLYQKMVPLIQSKDRLHRKLGDCFLAKNMLDSAFSYYKRLPPNDDVKRILYDLAMAYESSDLPDKAIEVLEGIMVVDVSYRDVTAKEDLNTKVEELRRKSMMISQMGQSHAPGTLPGVGSAKKTQLSGLGRQIEERYQVIRELGKGGMGVVYCARDTVLDRLVAMKVLADNLTTNQQARKRFLREAQATAKLQHPNIVHIYDLGESNNTSFIAMEYIEGKNLYDLLMEKKKFTMKDIVHYGTQIAQALGVAHQEGIVHRDIKPDNIMINKYGGVKITDFGIAHLMEAKMTMTGAKLGTPLYMSPEQVEGGKIDGRADIYSLGIMLYELAAGRPPFIKGDIAYHQVHTMPPPLTDFNKAIPPLFEELVMKAVAKKPEDRYPTAEALIDDLKNVPIAEE